MSDNESNHSGSEEESSNSEFVNQLACQVVDKNENSPRKSQVKMLQDKLMKAYVQYNLMQNDSLFQKLIAKADSYKEDEEFKITDKTAFIHAVKKYKAYLEGAIEEQYDEDDGDDDESGDETDMSVDDDDKSESEEQAWISHN